MEASELFSIPQLYEGILSSSVLGTGPSRETQRTGWWLWRQRSATICHLWAGDPGKHSESEGLRVKPRCPRAGEGGCPSSGRVNLPFFCLFVLFGPQGIQWCPPPGRADLPSLLSHWFKCQHSDRHTQKSRINSYLGIPEPRQDDT